MIEQILKYMGGEENIERMWHCMTRIRFNAKDDSKVDLEGLKSIDKVVGARHQNGQFQIIIGNNVAKVFAELESAVNITTDNNAPKKKSSNIFGAIIDTISGVFNPILPAIVGAGLVKAILSLVLVFAPSAVDHGVYQLFDMISDAAFYFMPFLLAASSAKIFNVNTSLALSVAGVLMYPTILNNAGESLSIFGLTLPYLNYSSTVIPIILGVLLLKYVDDFMKKIIPDMFSYVFIPLLSLSITIPITLLFLAPAGNYLSVYFADMVNWLFVNAAPLAGLIYVGLMPLIIMTGMHYAFFPTAIQSLQTVGFDIVLLPANLIHNVAQAGAAFAVAVKAKHNKDVRSTAISTGVSAIFGITEPAMYGVNLKYKKPFYAVMVTGGLVGTVAVWLGIKSYAFATPGLLSLPGYAGGTTFNLILAIVSYIVSGVMAFVLTLILKFDIEGEEVVESQTAISPINGTVVHLENVNDKVFADKLMGEGIAILPETDTFSAPFDGEIVMIFKTKHAFAIKDKNGVELLFHIGLETANLNGKYFEYLVNENDTVKKGQPIVKVDIDNLRKENYNLITPIVITNTDEFSNIEVLAPEGKITTGTEILKIVK